MRCRILKSLLTKSKSNEGFASHLKTKWVQGEDGSEAIIFEQKFFTKETSESLTILRLMRNDTKLCIRSFSMKPERLKEITDMLFEGVMQFEYTGKLFFENTIHRGNR